MSVEATNGISPIDSKEKDYGVGNFVQNNSVATNSIFDFGASTGNVSTNGLQASSGLIDKMQAFFEGLETREYDPRFSEFSGNSGGWNEINYYN